MMYISGKALYCHKRAKRGIGKRTQQKSKNIRIFQSLIVHDLADRSIFQTADLRETSGKIETKEIIYKCYCLISYDIIYYPIYLIL